MIIQIASNAVTAKLIDAPKEIKLHVSSLLSYIVDGAEFSVAYKSGKWDGRSTFFEFNKATFPAGFVYLVHAELTRLGHTVQLLRNKLPEPRGPLNPKVDEFEEDPNRDYQIETVRRLERYGQMIAQIATGGGKTRVCKLAVARIARPTLFLTTRSVLMYQMKSAFEEMRKKVGVLGDGEWSPQINGINVAMVQTLSARLKEPDPKDKPAAQKRQELLRNQTIKLLERFEFIILEEAHEAGGNSYYDITRNCRNAYYRLALTATPFMRGDAEANMRLMACSGPIGIRVTEKQLIERGILATPYFKYVSLPSPMPLYRTTPWQRAYRVGIVENEYRNASIVFEAKRAAEYGLPVMILVQHKAHGNILAAKLSKAGLKARFIFGESDKNERARALKELGSGKLNVLIGSTILDVGVDVPAVGMVILAGGGKAEVALRQRIGRGLRSKKSGPNVAFVLDFTDDKNNHLKEHSMTRRGIVDNTPGFAERVLAPEADFDFEALGFLKKSSDGAL